MPKKTKRQTRRSTPTIVNTLEPAITPSAFVRTPKEEFNPDYTYVRKDLRRISIIAGAFVVILVALSFFI